MKFEDNWNSTPSLQDENPALYDVLKDAVLQIDRPGTCELVQDYEYDSIILRVKTNGGIIGLVIYNYIEYLADISRDQVIDDIERVLGLKSGVHRLILENIYWHFGDTGNWPSESKVLIENRSRGEINDILEYLTRLGFVRIWHPKRPDAYCTLTVKGVSLCMIKGAIDYTTIYLRVLSCLAKFFINDPQSDYISWSQIVEKTGIEEENWKFIYTLLCNEEEVFPRNPDEKSRKIRLDKNSIRFEEIQSINAYFGIRNKIMNIQRSTNDSLGSDLGQTGLSDAASSYKSQFDVFISYSSKDQSVADEICQLLEKEGIKPFLAPKDIDSGDIGSEQIRKALLNSAEVAVLMSPNSINSQWVITEWGAAWVLRKRITPILLECKIDDIPKLLQDMQKRDYPYEIERFLGEVLKRKTNEPQTHPHLRPAAGH